MADGDNKIQPVQAVAAGNVVAPPGATVVVV